MKSAAVGIDPSRITVEITESALLVGQERPPSAWRACGMPG